MSFLTGPARHAYAQLTVEVGSPNRSPSAASPPHGDVTLAAKGTDALTRESILVVLSEIVADRGFAHTTLTVVLDRAHVSRRTFVRHFASLDDAFCALLDVGLAHTMAIVSDAFEYESTWQEGLLRAIVSVLESLDSERILARVWLVEALAAGRSALARWERNVELLRVHIVDCLPIQVVQAAPRLASAGALNAILATARGHVLADAGEPLAERLEPLLDLLAVPWLGSGSQATRGLSRDLVLSWLARHDAARAERASTPRAVWTFSQATSLCCRRTRAEECLAYIEVHPGTSNGEIAEALSIRHGSQVSRLLRGLLEHGLVRKEPEGLGRRTLWYPLRRP
jgi:AcrR family transcriptional regulator